MREYMSMCLRPCMYDMSTPPLLALLSPRCAVPDGRFVNVRFTVEDEATLIFDMPVTRIGPNSGVREEKKEK